MTVTVPAAPPSLVVPSTEDVAPHHTDARREQLASMVSRSMVVGKIRDKRPGHRQRRNWQEVAFDWVADGDDAIDAFRRLLLRLDRYQDVLRYRRLCRTGGEFGSVPARVGSTRPPPSQLDPFTRRLDLRRRAAWYPSAGRSVLLTGSSPAGEVSRATFQDEVWFAERSGEAIQRQEWFIRIGSGGSVRDLDTHVHLTRRMAHEFMLRSNRESVAHNLRWIQVLAMGGDQVMARAVQSTRLGRHLDHDEFWSTVVLFLATNPMIGPTLVGPVVDYVHHMRFAPRRVVREGSGVDEAPPPQPDFTMKGRRATKLLRQVEAWHGHLARVDNVVFQSWQTCGLRPYELEDETPELGQVRWTVQELSSSWELAAEGTSMGHCVVSYSDQCADGHTSVWSIGLQREDGTEREAVLTVAVDPKR